MFPVSKLQTICTNACVLRSGWKPRLFFYNSRHGHSGGAAAGGRMVVVVVVVEEENNRIFVLKQTAINVFQKHLFVHFLGLE